ncbi:type VI secretion system amidase immunity protein Tai4 [Pseudomonas sp. NPDC088444]|uniref:type VI secretion system amidase immunity protein Tai4 n=1 Tax=Pseudomonas sp. NPDC088444 TaxID=3364456 RepID=UPI00384B3566
MSKHRPLAVAMLIVSIFTPVSQAQDQIRNAPQAGGRTYSVNYKDMVLATCIATAYKNDPGAAKDAGSSVSALRDWTSFDLDQATRPIQDLVTDYLSRDYHNPVVESEVKGVRFDLLKCLDLYHSEALEAQIKRWGYTPDRSYRQDNPAPDE